MNGLPKGWVKAKLEQLCDFNPRHSPSVDRKKEVSFVPMPAVDDIQGNILPHATRPLEEVWKGYTHFQNNDVIFAKITPCMENGKIAVASGLYNGIACGSTEFHVLRSLEPVMPEYLWRFIRQSDFRKEAERHMTGAVGQRRVPVQFLKETIIPLPPLNEQRRIVAKLDSLFSRTRRARAELERVSGLCDRYRQAVLAAAIAGEMTQEWREHQKLPDLEKVKLAEVASEFSYGSSARSNPSGIVPVLRMGNIQNGLLDWSDLVYTSDSLEIEKYRLQEGDVLFNRTNSPELVGKTALYKGEREAINAGYLIRIRCCSKLLPEFLTYALNSPIGRYYCWQVKTDGVSQSNINAKKLGAFTFELPSIEEQEEIVLRVEKLFKVIDLMEQEYQKASKLCDRLEQATLTKAFRGELVPQDPNDEPASILLERIRAERQDQPKSKAIKSKKSKN